MEKSIFVQGKADKYMILAQTNANLFSKDPHTKVGAILLTADFTRILATGINGFPRKMNDETPAERWCRPTKYRYVAHAEMNAICNAAQSGTSTEGSVAVVTLYPCSNCAKALIQAGITKVYYPANSFYHNQEQWAEDFATAQEMFEECGVEVNALSSTSMTTTPVL